MTDICWSFPNTIVSLDFLIAGMLNLLIRLLGVFGIPVGFPLNPRRHFLKLGILNIFNMFLNKYMKEVGLHESVDDGVDSR